MTSELPVVIGVRGDDDRRTACETFRQQTPIPYRDGYTICPFSHGRAYYLDRRFVFTGWLISRGGCNVGPGCIWFETVDEAKRGIDCIYDAGGHDAPLDRSRDWVKKFWMLINASLHDEKAAP